VGWLCPPKIPLCPQTCKQIDLKNFKPYKIIHLDLSLLKDFKYIPTPNEGKYIVIWWKNIPLGEVYISPGLLLSASDLQIKIIYAVLPALNKYSATVNKNEISGEHTNIEKLKLTCDELLSKWEMQLPAVCNISVVICTRDRADILKKCLTYLNQQTSKPAEIIVVDNASVDERTKEVVKKFPGVIYQREERPGLDIARNTGANLARQPIVAFTDDDTTPHAHWVYHVWQTFQNKNIDAMTGLVLAAELNTEAQMIFEKHWPFNRGYTDKIFDKTFFNNTLPAGPPVWEVGAGANMAFRKNVFDKVGYFDERLDVGASGCSGDSEMWYRILANGLTIQYNPRAVVHHQHRESIEGLHKQLFYYMRGFTSAILVQYSRFGHRGNLKHLFITVPKYYVYLGRKGFPFYRFRHRTLLSEIRGVFSGLIFYLRHRKENP
jgi:glycosyltransferase involved in cell wall biosynthesis